MANEREARLKGKRVLVTGGAGFIGSELSRQLYAHGAMVTVVDNLFNGKRENLAGLPDDRLRLVVADVRDQERMTGLLEETDIVYHLAALGVRHSIHSPYETHQVNSEGALRMLEMARQVGVEQYIHVSSSEAYGTGSGSMTEEYPMSPNTVYGASKLSGEAYARAYYRTFGVPTVVVRPFNAYGPRCHHEGDSGEVIPSFVLRCLAGRPMVIFGDGAQSRDFTFVSDTARGIMLAGITPDCVGHTLNLGNEKTIAIKDLAHEVAAVVGVEPKIQYDPPRPGDVLYLCANMARARKLLQFEVRVPLREGLARLRDWYLSLDTSPAQLLDEIISRSWEAERKKPPLPTFGWTVEGVHSRASQ